jgi:uncharacterized membrane protein YidH (DUF202 family)
MNLRAGIDPEDEFEAGERTELAWARSGLALLACFVILARKVWTTGTHNGDLLAVALLGLGALGWAIGVGFRIQRTRGVIRGPRSPVELLAVALGTVAVGVAGFVIAFVNV